MCSSEFRRTPTADANDVANGKEPGRDHNHRGFSLWMAGGGVRGGMAYTTTAGKLASMFVALDSNVFAYFGEICYSGDLFVDLIDDTQRGEKK